MNQTLSTLLMIIGAGCILWLSYNTVKRYPQAFSALNINRSIFTLGILALLLIGFIALLVRLLH